MQRTRPSHDTQTCAACGSGASRSGARFCSTCGHSLSGDYAPAALLQASYHQRRMAAFGASLNSEPAALMISRQNNLTAGAFAFVTFSVVPFLGVLFCPFALLLGMCSWLQSTRHPNPIRTVRPAIAVALAVVISGVQLSLWWMLVNVTTMAGPG